MRIEVKGRNLQVTDDLRSFWSTTYFQVRKDLRVRYPKHSWPEDPLTAKPEATGSTAPWSWWQQAVCDVYILIGLAALTLVVIKNLPPRPERRDPGAAATLAAPHDQERGPVPSGTRDDASVPARPHLQGGGPLLPVPEAARAGTAAAPCAE